MMIKHQTATQLALHSASKPTEPLSLADKARLTQHRRLLPLFWCTACAKLSSMLTLEEASKILALTSRSTDPAGQSLIRVLSKGHETKISTGETLFCIHPLSRKGL
jgi:hypothetical protein